MSSTVPRVRSLDSVRGIAALVVVLHHCLLVFPDRPRWFAFSPMRLIDAGGQGAVLVFFALSGYVLFLTFVHKDAGRYWPYAVKRVARIYLPFAFAILFSALLLWLVPFRAPAGVSIWLTGSSASSVSAATIACHLAMTDRLQCQQLDNVMWSLVHELRISLIFPLIALAVMRSWRLAVGICAIVSIAAAAYWWSVRPDPLFDPISTARFLALFAAGAAVCHRHEAIAAAMARMSLPLALAAWAVSIALLTIPEYYLGSVIPNVAAIAILVLAVGDRHAAGLLERAPLLWSGRISYSLYLLHLPIIALLLRLLPDGVPIAGKLALAVPLSLAAAELGQRFIERPSQLLGRFAASKLA